MRAGGLVMDIRYRDWADGRGGRALRAGLIARIAALAVAGLSLAAAVMPAAAQDSIPLSQIKEDQDVLKGMIQDIQSAIQHREDGNAALSEQIGRRAEGTGAVTLEQLDQAQFEVDIARARLATLDNRIQSQTTALANLTNGIADAEARLATLPADDLGTLVESVTTEMRGQVAEESAQYLEQLSEFRSLSADHLSLNLENLALLRDKIGLDAVIDRKEFANDPRVRALRDIVNGLVEESIELANEASGMSPQTEQETIRRNYTRLRSDEALMRSTGRLADIDILEARELASRISVLVDDDAAPVPLLQSATVELNGLSSALKARSDSLGQQREAVGDLRAIAESEAAPGVEQRNDILARLDGLSDLLNTQEREIAGVNARIDQLNQQLTDQIAERNREAIETRQAVRSDAATLNRVQADVIGAPAKALSLFDAAYREVYSRVAGASWQVIGIFVAATLAIVGLVVLLVTRVLRRYVAADPNRHTALPVEVLRRNLIWGLPLAIWLIAVALFGISSETATLIGTIFALLLAGMIVRDFIQVIAVERVHGRRRAIGRVMTRLVEASLVLVGVILIGFLIVERINLLPSTEAWIHRAVFACFVIAALPLFLFGGFFLADDPAEGRRSWLQRIIRACIALAVPIMLVVIGVIGLIGYNALARWILLDAIKFLAIVAGLALALGVLHDGLRTYGRRLAEAYPGNTEFWTENFVDPIYRLGQIVFTGLAVALMFWVFNWTRETPVIRQVMDVFDYPLFRFANTSYTVGNILIAVLLVALVMWIGGWSRQVSYTLAYQRIRDLGIRQSLSVFTQYAVIVVGLLITLSFIGFDITTLTVFAASLGVGLGFGMQNVVNNFISGLLLLVERPLRLGDVVTVAGESGKVEQIGIRSLRIHTFDETDVIVPNSAVISDTFTNWSRSNSLARHVLTVGIGYDDDPKQAIAIIEDILKEHEGILSEPGPSAGVENFGDSAIDLRVAYYMDAAKVSLFGVRSEVLTAIWSRFREAGISIPYPQRDLHIVDVKGAQAALPAPEGVIPAQEPGDTDLLPPQAAATV